MPSTSSHQLDSSKKNKIIKSAYDSDTFEADGTIHVDGLVGSATISPSGRDVALASPEGIAIIDLDSPYSPPRRLSTHGLPWLVVDVQWSPFAARDYWVASTANHRCLVWNLSLREDSASGAIEHSLQGHTRAITDVNFSAHHPDILATCAVDGYVHSWDLRKPRQPVLTFCDWFAGATQVKYNRQDANILASSHDRWLHIWDERNPSAPLKSINAHASKIYGLDWNRTEATKVATCSLDKTIKLWDYATSDEPERIIRTGFPTWRARHTPFGWGLLAMPQNDPGNLYLYDLRRDNDALLDNTVNPVAVFPGHGSHKVREFLWRTRGGVSDGIDSRDFQLVSWGEDNELRLHKAGSDILESVGYVKGGEARKIPITRKGAAYKTYRAMDDHSAKERRAASMSDPRPNSGGNQHRRSALTLGMQMMAAHIPKPSKTPSWKGQPMKARPIAAKGTDRHFDQLGWMKGITMNKRKTSIIGIPQRKDSKDSTMFGPSFHHEHWGESETLHEEIIRISLLLPNVRWDNVDMESLTLKASLQGPWGTDGDTVYIEVKVDVPVKYPKARAPRFGIEKTALMSEQTYKKLNRDVNQLASQFSKKQQNCLEVAFSYLLGEIDLSNSDTFFKNVKDLDDGFSGVDDESSSEEEDNTIPAGGSAALSQELSASTELDATLAPVNRPTIPPNPRTCGGRFSNDGRLVCFFPTKEEKARVPFTPTDGFRERPKDEPTFASFGRLQQDSTPPRHRNLHDETSVTEDQSDSEASDESSSSSDSETTYPNKISMWYLPGRRFRKALSGTYSLHSSGGGTGIGTGTSVSRRINRRPKNIISIYNLAGDLPSKRELADEYRIFGDGADVCEHNAIVAQKFGRYDLVDVWRYAALLLRRDIPLELFDYEKQQDTVLVIAKDAVNRFGGDKAPSGDALDGNATLSGRVKWGHHPLAKHLIGDLFDYFEHLADVQMLAMLSCIFSESAAEDSVAYAESRLPQPETPLPMKAPSFSLDYFPLDASLWYASHTNYRSQANSAISTPKTIHTPHIVGSYGSEELWTGEPESTSFSCGETPPTRIPKDRLSGGNQTRSLSTSPNNRLLHRANTALTSSLASIQRPFTSVASTSPQGRKRISPGENFLTNLTPSNITWGSSTMMGATSEPSNTARNSLSDDEYRRDETPYLACFGISTEIEDQTIFDDDGWLAVPFLEPSRNAIYTGYRYTYAEMLQMWEQPLARLEVMKFNVLKDSPSTAHSALFGSAGTEGFYSSYHSTDNLSSVSHTHHNTHTPIAVGKKEQLQALITSGRGIDIRGICRVHEIHLDPIRSAQDHAMVGGGVGTCERCKRTQTQLFCVFCREPIDALYPPCLACGCAIHDPCLAEWHAAEERECPAGDECDCVGDASHGQIETIAAMVGALRQGKIRKPSEDNNGKTGHGKRGSADRYDWETVASGASLPLVDGQGKPLRYDHNRPQQPLSAARLSLGNKLRKSTGTWGSSPSLKRPGGVKSSLARQ
ncbi:putative WD repeat-containing protein [Rosellinia necatrix]|uniref:Putative WD repeat-containing protein n=1 Tax=Rosellinia necatrix TaxID=77044 RepID=A0A1W2TW94_ROSNE|nr:putative WD repeat-containing protein [Rosellinia necatrix]